VHVLARNPEKAVKVADECGVFGVGELLAPGSTALYEASLLINATQLGMAGEERMPGFVLSELDDMAEGASVFDMVYSPLDTDLLTTARCKGIRTVDGLVMLVGQAARAFEYFYGMAPPREHDAELRAILKA
jgi:shikimate dehydrogenase